MQLQPIVYVTDMARSTAWFTTLLGVEPQVASEHWTSYGVAGGHLALHLTDEAMPAGNVALSLVVDGPLEAVAERVTPTRDIGDEPFGRSLVVTDPDGALIQVNEHAG